MRWSCLCTSIQNNLSHFYVWLTSRTMINIQRVFKLSTFEEAQSVKPSKQPCQKKSLWGNCLLISNGPWLCSIVCKRSKESGARLRKQIYIVSPWNEQTSEDFLSCSKTKVGDALDADIECTSTLLPLLMSYPWVYWILYPNEMCMTTTDVILPSESIDSDVEFLYCPAPWKLSE